jgi:hypothetical protein
LKIAPFETAAVFVFPEVANCVGLQMGVLQLDFDSITTFFKLANWSFFGMESINTEALQLVIEDFPDGKRCFFLLEISFCIEHEDSFVPYSKDDTKAVTLLGVD